MREYTFQQAVDYIIKHGRGWDQVSANVLLHNNGWEHDRMIPEAALIRLLKKYRSKREQ